MRFRLGFRHLWWAVVLATGLLSWSEVPLPRPWEGWLISVDLWIINHTVYPGFFLVFVLLLVGTVVLPEAVRLMRRRLERERALARALGAQARVAREQADELLRRQLERERTTSARILRLPRRGWRRSGGEAAPEAQEQGDLFDEPEG